MGNARRGPSHHMSVVASWGSTQPCRLWNPRIEKNSSLFSGFISAKEDQGLLSNPRHTSEPAARSRALRSTKVPETAFMAARACGCSLDPPKLVMLPIALITGRATRPVTRASSDQSGNAGGTTPQGEERKKERNAKLQKQAHLWRPSRCLPPRH